ncbi:MAG: LysM peptidoglycan-binding domain-containing protein [Salinivirgaceae bacterium]|nr:LysM peptidoglycan-binding domain-containing protein [Salinivirgaceae bacterium]
MFRIVFTILLATVVLYGNSQNTTKSKERYNVVIIAGNKYIIHIVKKGETLFNISKRYDTPYDSVIKANPFIIPTSLEIGAAVKIPYTPSEEKPDEPPHTTQDSTNSPLYHIVKPGETVFRIALLYGIKPNDIFKINPGSEETIHPNQRLRIPSHIKSDVSEIKQDNDFIYHTTINNETSEDIANKYGVKSKFIKKANPSIEIDIADGTTIKIPKNKVDIVSELPVKLDTASFHYHMVKPQETLYGLGGLYKISIDEIKNQNPALKERELLAGEIIKLSLATITIPPLPEITSIEKDSVIVPQIDVPCPCIEKKFEGIMKVGLIMPFFTNINDTLLQTGNLPKVYARSTQFVEFYQGLLIALEDLKDQGLSIELFVFDSKNDTLEVDNIAQSLEFRNLDLLIGPAYSKHIAYITEEAKKYNIPIVSPFSVEEGFLLDYENAFMVSPSQKIQETESTRFLTTLKSDSFIVIFDGNQYDSTYIPILKSKIFERYTPETIEDLRYTEFAYYKGEESKLIELFIKQDTTVVIIPSSDKAFVSDIVARLNTLTAQQTIVLFGQPRWTRFENIKLEFFHNLNTHLYSLSYVDYSNKNIIEFVRKYRYYFDTEPKSRAFEGYDIAKFFIEALSKYSHDFRFCFENYSPNLLHMDLRMKQLNPKSGYINNNMYLLHFNQNYKINTISIK